MGDDSTLYVGGLANQVTEDHLYELFLQAGPLEKVCRPKDKDGMVKPFAFIEFSHPESVPYAIQVMDGIKLFNQHLRLKSRTGPQHDQGYHASSPSHHHHPLYSDSPSRDSRLGSRSDYHRSRSYHGPDDRKKGPYQSESSPHMSQSVNTGQEKKGTNGRSFSGPSTPINPLTQPFSSGAVFDATNSNMQPQQSYEDRRSRVLHKQSLGSSYQAHHHMSQGQKPYGNPAYNYNTHNQQGQTKQQPWYPNQQKW